MGARANGRDNLFGLGGRKNKFHVLWWFLNNLEQRIEALRGNHVGLVENEDFVAVAVGGKNCSLAKLTGVVNAVVAGGIDLDNV